MKRYLLLLVVFLVLPAQGQDVTWNKRFDPYDQLVGSFAWSVEVTADGNYVVFFNAGYIDWEDSISWSSRSGSLLLDANGIPLDTNRFDIPQKATYVGWCNASDKRPDGSMVIGGGTVAIGDALNDACIYITDPTGVILDIIEILRPAQDQIGRAVKSVPNGIVLCGVVDNAGNGDGFVMQLSLDGSLEWEYFFGGIHNDAFASLDIRTGGGFYTGGRYRSTSSNIDHWTMALNDTGGTIWNKVWGGPFIDNVAHVSTSADGHVLIGSAQGVGNNQWRKYLAKLHKDDGGFIWERMYGHVSEGSFYPLKEVAPGGDLITVGYHVVTGETRGVLMRTTSGGDSLWMRDYVYYDEQVTTGRGILRDVQPTPDGGFIAVGSTFPITGIYSQDVWVLKVDQHGCLEPAFHLIQGMETQITNMRDALQVWPNPVSVDGQVQVSWELPEHFKPQGQLKLTVTSSDGRLVHEERMPSPLSTGEGPGVRLQLSHLTSGLYHIHLTDATRWISGAKLVVE